ncbi:class I SAM-dependent methyltransferase [Saccharopolyspora sp. HNM0986]|uniref:class I SAM-dependent methyltransferase n=1 Tax=Saccharopolyspora galaxeae TaxID=2781241 RepID=UPI0019099770|nr:class I SAM-dependent methyltransferase [Saccharopolyspora sp. HNM0986]MBK0867773.1 class I SAM-dependent methyltransferase [Saccharopolyspora sp. HNM0986]
MTEAPEAVVEYWDARARLGYDSQPGQDPARALWAERVGPLVSDVVGRGAEVLDSGCGTGFLARLFAADGHRLTGQDVSAGMLAVAAERGAAEGLGIRWELGQSDRPPRGPFDAVVSRNVLWTLPDARQAVSAWARLLRPGGLLLLTDARWDSTASSDAAAEERFRESYSDTAGQLPMGYDFAACRELVARAGLVDIADRTSVFDDVPYPSAPGFFVLTARAPRR